MKKIAVRWIAVGLLLLMGFTHGGGYAITTWAIAQKMPETTCCVMKSCCCAPGACHCPGHDSKTKDRAMLMGMDCSPVTRILQLGFDTVPFLISVPVRVVTVDQYFNLEDGSSHGKIVATCLEILRPPQPYS